MHLTERNMGFVVYRITNLKNRRIYIGSTNNWLIRKAEHFGQLRQNKHCNRFLQLDFNIYKEEAFIFEVIHDDFKTREAMYLKEYELILKSNGHSYNIDTNCPVLGHSDIDRVKQPYVAQHHNRKQPPVRKNKKVRFKIKTQFPALDAIIERKKFRDRNRGRI